MDALRKRDGLGRPTLQAIMEILSPTNLAAAAARFFSAANRAAIDDVSRALQETAS
jgi:hypothetical protein